MRTLLYCIILAGILIFPVKKEDIGDLEPIQAVWMSVENDTVFLQTDTGDSGAGDTVAAAIEEMKHNSEGVVYLDTAQYLLVSENAADKIEEIMMHLKSSVKICLWEGSDVEAAARYMQSHDIGSKLKDLQKGEQLRKIPQLSQKESKTVS